MPDQSSATPPNTAARRIAVIGGGSAYMPGVIREFRRRADLLAGSELVLYDVDAESAAVVGRLAQRMFQARSAPINVRTVDTLEAAIDGADFIFTTFRPGGLVARHLDESIPLRHGILGQETIGPGGFFMACRSVPILLNIATKAARLAPDAWIINYTNPTNIVTAAVTRFGATQRIIGLCDQYLGDQDIWARLLGMRAEALEVDWRGTNHGTWASTVRQDGVDVSAEVQRRLEALVPERIDDPDERMLAQIAHDFGYLVNSYARYYYFHDEMVARLRDKPTTRAQDIQAVIPALRQDFAEQADADDPDPSTERGGAEHGELAVDTILAISLDEGRRILANTTNDGALPGVDANAIVELPVCVGADGLRHQPVDALPHPANGLTQAILEYEWLAADAAVTGNTRTALKALMAHPFIRSRSTAQAILADGLHEHREYLPQF